MIIQGNYFQTSLSAACLLLFAAMALADGVKFHTRSGRGADPLPPGCGPRGPVGPSDSEVRVEFPAATVDGAGRQGTP